jgi:hypothetical protein
MKKGFKAMKMIIIQLKQSDMMQYKVVRKEVVNEGNYTIIMKIKSIRGAK